jgi:hypothetical protein
MEVSTAVDERNRAVTMLLTFTTQQEVATVLGVHQTNDDDHLL